MTGEAKALELFDQATKTVRASNLINREGIAEYGRAAMRAIDAALKVNDIRSAIDTMQKTKAFEDYVKSQISRKRVTVVDANHLVVVVLKIIRELGWWLDENLVEAGTTKMYSSPLPPEIAAVLKIKPKFYLDDLGITASTSSKWQKIARMPDEEFDTYITPFLEIDKEDRDDLLSVNKLLRYLALKKQADDYKDVEVVEKPEIKMTSSGNKIYNKKKSLESDLRDWLATVSDKDKMTNRELLFLENVMNAHYYFIGGVMRLIMRELEARGYER